MNFEGEAHGFWIKTALHLNEYKEHSKYLVF